MIVAQETFLFEANVIFTQIIITFIKILNPRLSTQPLGHASTSRERRSIM